MKKQSLFTALLVVLMSMIGVKTSAHDIAVVNADGVTIYYEWTNNNTELAVSYFGSSWNTFNNEYSGSVVIPESVDYNGKKYSVISIGESAFEGCSGLTSVTIPNSVTSIGVGAFYNCSGLTSITIPNSITSIGTSAFYGCRLLSSLTIPNSVISIGANAFAYTSWYDNQPDGLIYVGNFAYKYKGEMPINTNIYINEGTKGIAGGAFSGCSGLTYIFIPNCVKFIGESAFSGCSGLTSISIPNSVTYIHRSAFQNCTGLYALTIPNSVTGIGNEAFRGCSSLKSLIIGSGVTSIGYDAFYDTYILKIIWLTNTPPQSFEYVKGVIHYVSNGQFSRLNGRVIKYQFLSSYFDVDGIRYVPIKPSERTCDAIDCVYNESAANTIIASTVNYKGVSLNVKNINPYLAYNNKFIKTLTVDNDGELADHVFSYCSNMKSVSLGSKITAIGSHAFQGCSSIETIDIPDLVPVLNIYTFADCTSLKEIKIKPLMTDIKNSVFNNCKSLALVIIADSEEELNLGSNQKKNINTGNYEDYGNPLFSSCPLDSVYIGRNINYPTLSSYGYSPFYRNLSLRAVKITDKETEISENEFYGCTNLQRVIIGDGVTIIKKWAFSDCSSLLYFAYGTQLNTIEQEAFSDCASVVEISSKAASPPVCGSQALDDINKWECKLYVPDGSAESYQIADQWKDFFFTEVGGGTVEQGGGTQVKNKCEMPTISLVGDKLTFGCKTEGTLFHYSISFSDVQNGVANKDVELTKSLSVSVYATKEGYNDSDVASANFKVSDTGLRGDLNKDGEVNVADHVELSKIIMDQE